MRHVVFVNGPQGAGKDTVVGMAIGALGAIGVQGHAVSSIDPVRDLLRQESAIRDAMLKIGKTDGTRNMLAEIGRTLEEYCQFRSKETARRVCDKLLGWEDVTIFVHVRERAVMKAIEKAVGTKLYQEWSATNPRALGGRHDETPDFRLQFHTLYVQNPRVDKVASNASDQEALDSGTPYDWVMMNDGTLRQLHAKVVDYVHAALT